MPNESSSSKPPVQPGAPVKSRTLSAAELVNVTHTKSAGVRDVLKASPHQCFDPYSVAPAASPPSRRVRVTGGGQWVKSGALSSSRQDRQNELRRRTTTLVLRCPNSASVILDN
jgi:hypothetical protein